MPLKAALSGKHCNRHCASSACPTPATQIGNQLGGRSRCRLPIFGTRAPSQRQLAEYRRDERASGTRPLRPPARPASVTLSRTTTLAITAPPSPAASLRETSRAAGGRRDMHAQLSRARGRFSGSGPWLVRGRAPVRGRPCKADGPSHRSRATIPVRHTSVDPRTQRHPPVQSGTPRHTDETAH